MRQVLNILICLYILSALGLHAEAGEQRKSIAPSGETVIAFNIEKLNVRVKIITHEVDIGKPSRDKWPDLLQSNRSSCTYTRYPCSIVDGIDIAVNGKQIRVPRSVFCALADLNSGEIKLENSKSILLLDGGHSIYHYYAKIEFDREDVKRMSVYADSSMTPAVLLQEAIYHVVTYE